jgi:DNA-binding GntR family transcriptional regulator
MSLPASPTLTVSTYDRLRADVLAGRWAPERKLLMHELRTCYSVGATPLREALNRLASEGWVVHNEQRGFCVAAVSPERLRDLVQTRIAVESLALAKAIQNPSPAWEEHLLLAFHRLSRTPRSRLAESFKENPEWEQLHREFHLALLSGCNSPLLLGFCEQLYDQAYRYRMLAAQTAYKRRDELDEHRQLFDAVMQGKLDTAQALLSDHYQRTASIISVPSDARSTGARRTGTRAST